MHMTLFSITKAVFAAYQECSGNKTDFINRLGAILSDSRFTLKYNDTDALFSELIIADASPLHISVALLPVSSHFEFIFSNQ